MGSEEKDQPQDAMQAAMPLGPMEQKDLMALETSLAHQDAVWSLGQAPEGELQLRPLEFWRKAMPSLIGNYSPFKTQLLICYRMLNHGPPSHHVT